MDKTKKAGIVIVFDTDVSRTEITMREFIEILQAEHDVDEVLPLGEVHYNHDD